MSITSSLISQWIPDLNTHGNLIKSWWDRLGSTAVGRRLFSKAVGMAAPYTGSIQAQVQTLQTGFAKVTLEDRPHVRNHLDCLHAIALANLAELTGNLALSYSMPPDARFIVAGINMEYLHKARGTITAECTSPIPKTSARHEYLVEVVMLDQAGVTVTRATLRTLVGPKKR